MENEWSLTNWTMKEKGEEIFVFFEMFCIAVIISIAGICKIVDWLEK